MRSDYNNYSMNQGRRNDYPQDTACPPSTVSSMPSMPSMPPEPKKCCCKKSMTDALKLLCESEISTYIDFQKFAFLSPAFLVGSKLTLIEPGDGTKDNLAELKGEFKRFTVGNCDTIDISGTAVYNIPVPYGLTGSKEEICALLEQTGSLLKDTEGTDALSAVLKETLKLLNSDTFGEAFFKAILKFLIHWFTVLPDVTQASLCNLQSVAFELKYASDFDFVKSVLLESLEHTDTGCSECRGHCKCDDCCCNDGIKFGLLSANASHTVTLTAGSLVLREVEALGNIGNILVFGNKEEGRFYFVCADTVAFLG